MIARSSLLALACLLGVAIADTKAYIETHAEYNTECKTCPRSLCPNKLYYGTDDKFNATCWTRGTKIMDGNLWLKSEAGCYVTQYDVVEYSGDYKTDLEYCGRASEEENLTEEDATLQYKSECRLCPTIDCDIVSYLPEETDVTLTCWTDQGQTVIDDPYWLKTTNNCYVAEKSLYSKPDITYLDNCGPVPGLEWEKHHNENGTSDVDKREPLPVPIEQGAQYLINVTVGEDWAKCYKWPNATSSRVVTKYSFNSEIWLQCVVSTDQWYSETTDFCYVKNADLWQDPAGDYYRMPLCDYFTDPDSQEPCSIGCGKSS